VLLGIGLQNPFVPAQCARQAFPTFSLSVNGIRPWGP